VQVPLFTTEICNLTKKSVHRFNDEAVVSLLSVLQLDCSKCENSREIVQSDKTAETDISLGIC